MQAYVFSEGKTVIFVFLVKSQHLVIQMNAYFCSPSALISYKSWVDYLLTHQYITVIKIVFPLLLFNHQSTCFQSDKLYLQVCGCKGHILEGTLFIYSFWSHRLWHFICKIRLVVFCTRWTFVSTIVKVCLVQVEYLPKQLFMM